MDLMKGTFYLSNFFFFIILLLFPLSNHLYPPLSSTTTLPSTTTFNFPLSTIHQHFFFYIHHQLFILHTPPLSLNLSSTIIFSVFPWIYKVTNQTWHTTWLSNQMPLATTASFGWSGFKLKHLNWMPLANQSRFFLSLTNRCADCRSPQMFTPIIVPPNTATTINTTSSSTTFVA